MVQTGLDNLITNNNLASNLLYGHKLGLLINPSSINSNYKHILRILNERKEQFNLKKVFTPQHGYKGDVQANMLESKDMLDPINKVGVYSLYSKTREPTKEMLEDIDTIIIDLQDVGTRVYTYIWTMFKMLEGAAKYNKNVILLDRPNPIGSVAIEGNVLEAEYKSFVGLYPIPMRHGMTIGELAIMFNNKIKSNLKVIRMNNYKRDMFFCETQLPWVMPSPNMPTPQTAILYPMGVIFEGTNVSEGRGTTLPFELIGAPYIDANELKREMDTHKIPYVYFREVYFTPTFDKYAGECCNGLQIHPLDEKKFRPYLVGLVLLSSIKKLYYKVFKWLEGPYEYEYTKRPIDIILGSKNLRKSLFTKENIYDTIEDSWRENLNNFIKERNGSLLY